MSRLDVRRAGLVASPHHRKFALGRLDIFGLSLRVAAAALLGGVAWIHVHLWQEGYKHIPTIGPLFLVGAASAVVMGALLLVWPTRLFGLVAAGVDIGILASLALSINVGLFGFKESLSGSFVVESIVLEAIGAGVVLLWIIVDFAASEASKEVRSGSSESTWRQRAHQAEAEADELARALDFHVVNECDCHGRSDVAILKRHYIRRLRGGPGGDRTHDRGIMSPLL